MSFLTFQLQTELVTTNVQSLLLNERNYIANAANISSLVFHSFESVNWVGFYFFDGNELVLGPFQGKPACIRIAIGRGVCGTVAKVGKTIVVDDVDTFKGHIACDSESKSEVVIPIFKNNQLIGVFDLDSPKTKRFSQSDVLLLEKIVSMYIQFSEFPTI